MKVTLTTSSTIRRLHIVLSHYAIWGLMVGVPAASDLNSCYICVLLSGIIMRTGVWYLVLVLLGSHGCQAVPGFEILFALRLCIQYITRD